MARVRTVTLFVFASLVAFGCTRRDEPTAHPEAPRPPATPVERAEPVAPTVLPDPMEITFRTSDGVTIHGTLYPAPDRGAPAVVLVHQLGSTRAEWASVIEALRTRPALTVLAIDMRGHGASTEGPDGALAYGAFDTAAWTAVENDVAGAVLYLRGDTSPVLPARAGLVGASIGATAVVRTAARDPELDVIAVLSPGRAYHGVDGILPAVSMGPRAFLALAARGELDCVETAEALARITGGRAELVDGDAHGVAILAADTSRVEALAAFLREALARPRAAPVPSGTATEPAPDQPAPAPSGTEP